MISLIKFIDKLLNAVISKNTVWLIFVVSFMHFIFDTELSLRFFLMFMLIFTMLVISLVLCVWTCELFFKQYVDQYIKEKHSIIECNNIEETKKK